MKITNLLFEASKGKWQQAAAQPFVAEMASGKLSSERFRYYMLQDYYYLQAYIDILNIIRSHAETDEQREFIDVTIQVTKDELTQVHIPSMAQMGITQEQIDTVGLSDAGKAYLDYLRKVSDGPVLRGLTALLQCCWLYAYIAREWMEKSADTIAASPYKTWFAAYTAPEYVAARDAWVDLVDRLAEVADTVERAQLCEIFVTCAGHENSFWEAAYKMG
ncbi:MAG: hypothetical protein J5757_05105 [Lachnospiraceae bacterium]|nr:hypothetical protein [Lachnospiraceae bacterium]